MSMRKSFHDAIILFGAFLMMIIGTAIAAVTMNYAKPYFESELARFGIFMFTAMFCFSLMLWGLNKLTDYLEKRELNGT